MFAAFRVPAFRASVLRTSVFRVPAFRTADSRVPVSRVSAFRSAAFRAALLRRTGAAVAGTSAVALLAAGCGSAGTGVREEGPVDTGSPTVVSSAPAPSESPDRVDAVRLIKGDPKVSSDIRKGLKPCAANEYPVDVSYGTLTGNSEPDVVINVLTCGDSFGIGSYVYRVDSAAGDGTDAYENVFTDESSPVYAEITSGELEVSKQVYGPGDKVCCPSGEDVITYSWSGGRFDERARTHNDYSKAAGGGTETGAEPED
ncbi:hypothetical protein [Streptomyces sp. Ru87]|uniref:hypothetical protein n=1 Tax=Streptomyces sp. Ru87 TaxID=2044307 RepID=UPI002678C0C3|nr:hypothetical protein [Streptomyces sp. Ru87]